VPADFDFGWTMQFLALRTVPTLERVAAGTYQRVVRLEDSGQPVALTIQAVSGIRRGARQARWRGHLLIRSAPAVPARRLRGLVVRMFGLDADLSGFLAMARRDPVLRAVLRANPPGLRVPQVPDPFEALIRAILGQQVSVAAASTMTDRLVRQHAAPAPPFSPGAGAPPSPPLAFPRAEEIVAAGRGALRDIGLTRAKAAAIHGVSAAVADGAIDLAALRRRPAEEVDRELMELPGVGPWTAAYLRLRALGDRDAFPATDLGVLKALAARGVSRERALAVSERWRPWRAYATLHLWHSLAASGAEGRREA
jgi:3-methyladenine DNA glycosylase/8-oxoguanine DNA glycosylase